VFVVGVLDSAFTGLMGLTLLGLLAVGLAFLMHLVNFAVQFRSLGVRGLIPLCACLAVGPAVWTVGPQLLRALFFWNRDRYEAVADAVRAGSHPESLSGDERHLAHQVRATRYRELDDKDDSLLRRSSCVDARDVVSGNATHVVGVQFLIVTHGFAGHSGFVRASDPVAERCLRRGQGVADWQSSTPLADHWYLVAN
jgi:hypothetical protein